MVETFQHNEHAMKFVKYSLLKKIGFIIGQWILLDIMVFFLAFLISTHFLAALGFFIGFNIYYIFYTVSMFILIPLNKKLKIYDKNCENFYFEGEIIYMLINYIGASPMLILIVMGYGSLLTGIGIALAIIFPSIIIFIRRKTCFNEESAEIESSDTEVLGYNPQKYRSYSILCGVPTIVFPFYCLDFFATNPARLIIIVIWILLGFIIIYNYLKPDKWNEKLNFENKTYSGFKKYTLIYCAISLIFGFGLSGILVLMGVN